MRIIDDYEGANPSSKDAIEQTGDAQFVIHPWSEDGDGNYKFNLNVKIVNEKATSQQAELSVCWANELWMCDRDYVLLGRGPSWRHIQGEVERATTHVEMTVPPGEWYLGLSPVYDLGMFAADRERAVAAGFQQEVYGQSYQGRDLYALSIGAEGAPVVFVVSRYHPYETAGSYCTSAILELLAQDLSAGGPLTSSFRFVVVPMPNPDGVALGCGKRTREGGLDLPHQGYGADEPAGKALTQLLNASAPTGYLDIHGWMYREKDWMIYSNSEAFEALRPTLDRPEFDKALQLDHTGDRTARSTTDFATQARTTLGAIALVPSISFFFRQPAQMREIGRTLLTGFCSVLSA